VPRPQQRIVIIGLGYVGLPLAREASRAIDGVVGLDASTRVVETLMNGQSHVDDIADADVAAMIADGFVATSDPACLADADVAVICVPTPLSGDGIPDLDAVMGATRVIAQHLHPGMLVVLESTTYPGTTDGPVREMLESSGLSAGVDFALVFSPERIDPGNPVYGLRNTPKVVGGLTPECSARAVEFYGTFIDTVVPTTGPREAEMAKLLENTYRHVNIALVNEMAVFCHDLGVDLWESIDAAKTKPFGFQAFYPGPGVGGHCIPIDPNYLSYKVRTLGYPFRFVELAQEVSARMPAYVVSRAIRMLNTRRLSMSGSTILLLGVTYKRDISDERESPAQPLARRLLDLDAHVVYADPHVEDWTIDGEPIERCTDPVRGARDADLTILLQDHREFDLDAIADAAPAVLDTRGRLRGERVERL
jgi:nucleotide sugar dehydrogenase